VPIGRSEVAAAFADPLAERLWTARAESRVLAPDGGWSEVDLARAERIAAQLYLGAGADRAVAWKLGALDRASRTRLGLNGPLVAPVLPDRLHLDATSVTLNREEFVQPRFEPEVGLVLDSPGADPRVAACIEIADCRFPGWLPPPGVAVADFGLQGAMVFGPACLAVGEVAVLVRHDGREVADARSSLAEVTARLDLVRPLLAGSAGPAHIATGAMTALLDAAPGTWEFDFTGATTVAVTLT